MSPKFDTSGRAVAPRPPPPDSLAELCANHAHVPTNGHFPSGTVFGDWRLTAFIGRGGNGEVYCAEHTTLGTSAAVKVLMREDERAKIRFTREARLLSDLKSEAFPRFLAYGEANGFPYLAMELLEPGELPTGDNAIARFLLKVCDAVAELHSHGYVHRDIKPGNILWRTVGPRSRASLPVPVLADLGLVKEIKTTDFGLRTPSLTVVDGRRAGVGTPGYGAPEQMERGEATVTSDIHALGVLADRCFDGNPPRVWSRIIQRATSSIPVHRYQSVSALASAIRWRHLWRYVIGMTVPLLVLAAATNIEPRGVGPNQEPKTAVNMVGGMTNMAFASVIRLNGKKEVLPEPIVLEGCKEYRIIGPGTLDADLFCPTTAVVRLKNCVLLNRTKRLYPENGIQYRLENGVYLNFISIKKKPLWLTEWDFLGSFDGAFNKVRFGGPETVEELLEQISEDQRKKMEEMSRQ